MKSKSSFLKPVVNGLWINESADDPNGEILCTIPLDRLDPFFDNARRYPDVPFLLWVDYKPLSLSTKFFLDTYFYLMAPNNVSRRDLRSIPEYANDPLFNLYTNPNKIWRCLWARTDLARLLVAKHILESTKHDGVIYADLDVPDVSPYGPQDREAEQSLQKYGFVVGKNPDVGLENSYFMFSRHNTKFFLDHYLPRARQAAQSGRDGYQCMFYAISDYLDSIEGSFYDRNPVPDDLGGVFVYPTHYNAPRSPLMAEAVCAGLA